MELNNDESSNIEDRRGEGGGFGGGGLGGGGFGGIGKPTRVVLSRDANLAGSRRKRHNARANKPSAIPAKIAKGRADACVGDPRAA